MPKLGKPFELVVADVMREVDHRSIVRQGDWVVGPDGRRELDVVIKGTVNGERRTVLIECKDFNPKTTGPVGIGYVDALESKQRDLGTDISFICSNAGFTADAIRKAKRVGIGLIGVLREGDRRIRYQVVEEIYTRKVKVENISITLQGDGPFPLDRFKPGDITYKGVPVLNWVIKRATLLISSNPIVKGKYTDNCKFRHPVEFKLPSGPVSVTQLISRMELSGGWFAQNVTMDGTSAVYDWLRRRIQRAPGPGKIHLKDVDFQKGEPIDCPPDSELNMHTDLRDGEIWMGLMTIDGLGEQKPIPEIDGLVVEGDLDLTLSDLSPAQYMSGTA